LQPDTTKSWRALTGLASRQQDAEADGDPRAPIDLKIQAAGLLGDLSKQHLTTEVLDGLLDLLPVVSGHFDDISCSVAAGPKPRPSVDSFSTRRRWMPSPMS